MPSPTRKSDANQSSLLKSDGSGEELIELEQLCQQLTWSFGQRAEAVLVRALEGRIAPQGGVRITLTELGMGMDAQSTGLTPHESRQRLCYLTELRNLLAELPAPTIAERLLVWLTRWARACITSRCPLVVRKQVLRALATWRDRVGSGVPDHRDQHRTLTIALGTLFNEPAAATRELLTQHRFWMEYQYARRLLHLSSPKYSDRMLAGFQWPDRETYRWLSQGSGQARVLVTIHMGDFFGAFRLIAAQADSDRTVTSLRREVDDGAVQKLLVNNPSGHRIARHGVEQPASIVAALRQGNHTLTALFDLSSAFGETAPVTFFGQPARFVRGPAQLAIMGRAVIVPFVTYEHKGQQVIEMEAMIAASRRPDESLVTAATRVTQQLVKLAERWISQRPEQWKYLDKTMSYFEWPRESGATRRDGGAHA